MVIRTVTLVVTGALIVVGAGIGGYLAVRENRAVQTLVAERGTPATDLTADDAEIAVAVTEERIEEAVDPSGAAPSSDPPATPTPSPPQPERPASPPPTRQTPASPPEPAAASADDATDEPNAEPAPPRVPTANAPRRGAGTDTRPTPRGWDRLEEPWPSRSAEDRSERDPSQVDLRDVSRRTGVRLPPEERPPAVEELVIPADSVIGLQVDTTVSTDDARVEDRVEARVTRDVLVDDQVAIPAGSRVVGSVVLVEQVGRLRGTARLGVRFHTVLLEEIHEVPISTDTVYREGKSRGGDSARKIGGAAIGGAILGAIFGGRQGAAIGGAAGAATGTAAAMGGNGDAATLPLGATVTVRLSNPATVTVVY